MIIKDDYNDYKFKLSSKVTYSTFEKKSYFNTNLIYLIL